VPAVLAQYANSANAVLVHYSTDFVFDGQKSTPYLENDLTHPLSVYGQSKLEGEKAIEASACQHLVFRTGWLMGAYGQNFLKTMLRLAKERKELKVIADQHGAPTSAKWLAWVSTLALSKCLALKASSERPPWGLYHASSKGETTWHAYAQEAIAYAQQLGAKHLLKAHEVLAIPSTSYPLPAKRPSYSVLSTDKLERTFDIHPPLWSAVVREVIEEIEVRGGLELNL
jgi:dTDP-4-dehydrorhamnose reductase